ncbi:MAG: hypothetical protein M1823_006652, partial [Watsoniomyces obsoletus]
MRSKKLQVTNAFHSKLVDPLMDSLEASARNLPFKEPTIPIWRATELGSCDTFSPKFVADHMRSPVYFNHAVQRLARQYPSCVWLEAGSASTVTNMAGRALSNPTNAHFQGINITCDNALDNLNDATLSLWKAGCKNISFWGHHSSQTAEHAPLLLPPYQFEKARHWVDLKKVPQPASTQPVAEKETLPDNLLTFINYRDSQSRCARFRINTAIPKYERLISGHVIAETAPICPATVQLDLAIEALRSLRPDLVSSGLQPQIQGVKNQSP